MCTKKIVRADGAGVFFGNVVEENEQSKTVVMTDDLYYRKMESTSTTDLVDMVRERDERIAELEKKNEELKEKWLQATDEGTSWAHLKSLERENEELKELIKNIIRVTWGEGWNYSLDWKVKAEQYLKEV